MEAVACYKYLGVPFGRSVLRNSRPAPFGKYFERIERKARARGMVTRFLGAQRDGLRPKTALRLYKSYAAPVLVFSDSQLGIVKRMLGLRENTKNESVRVISGVEPIAVRLGFLKLKHQYRILQKPDTSLVKKVYLEIAVQPGREEFHREYEELRRISHRKPDFAHIFTKSYLRLAPETPLGDSSHR